VQEKFEVDIKEQIDTVTYVKYYGLGIIDPRGELGVY
jgi:hypothetical protein